MVLLELDVAKSCLIVFWILEWWPFKKITCTKASLEFDSREVPAYPKLTLYTLKWVARPPPWIPRGIFCIYIFTYIYIYIAVLIHECNIIVNVRMFEREVFLLLHWFMDCFIGCRGPQAPMKAWLVPNPKMLTSWWLRRFHGLYSNVENVWKVLSCWKWRHQQLGMVF